MQYEHMPKRLMVIERAGHQFCSDLCWIGRDHGGIADIAERAGVWPVVPGVNTDTAIRTSAGLCSSLPRGPC